MTKDNKDASVRACVTPETKAEAEQILKRHKLTISKFIRIVLEQLVKDHSIYGSSITVKIPDKKD